VIALLDVNVLVALFDPNHVHHDAAHEWFGAHRAAGWATCPVSENGVVRVLSNPAYADPPTQPGEVVERLRTFCDSGHHTFWPDDVTLRDARTFRWDAAVSFRTLTDMYLVGLAAKHHGRLATFDRSINHKPVVGAERGHVVVIPA